KSGGRELLAGPVTLRATAGDVARGWDEATVRWVEMAETHAGAVFAARTPGAETRVTMRCSYDGLITFDVKVNPVGDRSLSEVRLGIPVAAEFASYMQIAGGAGESVATFEGREEHTQAFAPMVWLSGHERGLQWLCASDTSWALEEPERAIRVTPGRGQTTLVVTMLDRELLPGESFETSFGLQATPVGPRRGDWREWRTATLHGLPLPAEDEGAEALVGRMRAHGVRTIVLDDENYRPRPDGLGAESDALLAEFAEICHEAGLRLVLVIDDDLTRDPVWRSFGDEVAVNADAEGDAARPCPGSAWADYVVEAAAYAMEQYKADGIHLRGGLSALDCGGHAADGSCGTTGARELVMRLRTVVRESRPDGLLTVESGGATPGAAGFADGLVVAASDAGGEAVSVDEFAALGGTGAFGTAVAVTPGAAEMQHARGLALLHDVALRPAATGEGLAAVAAAREAREQFNVATANWRPWWSGRVPVTTEAADVRVSAWWRDGEVLAVVANLGDEAPVVELALDRERIELGPWLWAVDRLDGRRIRQIGDVLRMRMEAGQVSLIHVQSRDERNEDFDE
ncbi:MAG: glycoside hydrolase domain-containing protein, partial [Armatimonadota bacterium]